MHGGRGARQYWRDRECRLRMELRVVNGFCERDIFVFGDRHLFFFVVDYGFKEGCRNADRRQYVFDIRVCH